MKTKIIVLAFIAVILIALLVFLSIPHNLNNTLHLNDSEWVSISIHVNRIVSGQEGSQSVSEAESFTFQRGTEEFAATNDLLGGYSYTMTIARKTEDFSSNNATIAITILGDNDSSLVLFDTSGRNVAVNGTPRRMSEKKVIELLDKIIDFCGM